MTYDFKKMQKKAIEAITAHELVFVTDVPAYLGMPTSTFYLKQLDKDEEIRDAIQNNRIRLKNTLKDRWKDSENATLQVALYKIICSDEEAHRLNGSKREIKQEIVDHKSILEELEKDYDDEELEHDDDEEYED